MARKFVWCLMHLCLQWVGSCQGSVSAAGRGSVSPGMALSILIAPCSCSLGLFAVLLHHGPFPCHTSLFCSAGGSHPSAPQPSVPQGAALWSPALFCLGLSLALKAHQHGTLQHSMWGIWAGRVLQGRETATSNSCPSFYLHAKDGKIIFPFAFK